MYAGDGRDLWQQVSRRQSFADDCLLAGAVGRGQAAGAAILVDERAPQQHGAWGWGCVGYSNPHVNGGARLRPAIASPFNPQKYDLSEVCNRYRRALQFKAHEPIDLLCGRCAPPFYMRKLLPHQ